jgi:hypothetical protein
LFTRRPVSSVHFRRQFPIALHEGAQLRDLLVDQVVVGDNLVEHVVVLVFDAGRQDVFAHQEALGRVIVLDAALERLVSVSP